MRKQITATDNLGNEIFIDPNHLRINAAGTRMEVACYPEKDLDRGDRQPKYFNFHHLKLDPTDKEVLETIFKQEVASQVALKIANQKALRKSKRQKNITRARL